MGENKTDWRECPDCGTAYCPDCLGRMRKEQEQLEALRDDPHRRILAVCPSCHAELGQIEGI